MRTVILLDRSFARRERELLSRLEIGLADEGLRVLHAVPNEIIETEFVGVYSSSIGYDDRGFPTTDRARVRELMQAIGRAVEAEPGGSVDVVHSFGQGCERLAVELASAVGASTLIETWQRLSFDAAAEAYWRDPGNVTVLLPDPEMFRLFTRLHKQVRAEEVDWGVHASGETVEARFSPERGSAPSVALLAECADMPRLEAALAGLAAAVSADAPGASGGGSLADLLVFVDADRVRSPRLWRAARRHGLLDRLSIVPRAEARREPILHLGALLVPEPTGRFRSIVLDAMARGVPVVAAPDPSISILSDPAIARLVQTPSAAAWSEAVRATLCEPAERERLTRSAKDFIRSRRSASAHVAAVIRAYSEAVARRARGEASSVGG